MLTAMAEMCNGRGLGALKGGLNTAWAEQGKLPRGNDAHFFYFFKKGIINIPKKKKKKAQMLNIQFGKF